jgi:serine/threonine protein kinase
MRPADPGSSPPAPSPPETARRFRTGGQICSGLFAWEQLGDGRRFESWLAWSVPRWSHVVVKLPLEQFTDDLRTARHLGREARLLSRLSHPAIQHLLEDAHRDPVPHLVLEYVEGPTLATLLDESGSQAPAAVVDVGMQLASCLHFVHRLGLVHLDLKPGNVVLKNGRAVLLDFDIARRAGQPPPPGRPHGTRAYMAPEQCRRAATDSRMDLFALGAVLYELATGQPAFVAGKGAGAYEFPQLVQRPARARTLRPGLPTDLDVAIHALLERDPARRPPTALAALRLLRGALPPDEGPAWPAFADAALAGPGAPRPAIPRGG